MARHGFIRFPCFFCFILFPFSFLPPSTTFCPLGLHFQAFPQQSSRIDAKTSTVALSTSPEACITKKTRAHTDIPSRAFTRIRINIYAFTHVHVYTFPHLRIYALTHLHISPHPATLLSFLVSFFVALFLWCGKVRKKEKGKKEEIKKARKKERKEGRKKENNEITKEIKKRERKECIYKGRKERKQKEETEIWKNNS